MSSPSFSIPSIFCHKNLSAFSIYQSARFPPIPCLRFYTFPRHLNLLLFRIIPLINLYF